MAIIEMRFLDESHGIQLDDEEEDCVFCATAAQSKVFEDIGDYGFIVGTFDNESPHCHQVTYLGVYQNRPVFKCECVDIVKALVFVRRLKHKQQLAVN